MVQLGEKQVFLKIIFRFATSVALNESFEQIKFQDFTHMITYFWVTIFQKCHCHGSKKARNFHWPIEYFSSLSAIILQILFHYSFIQSRPIKKNCILCYYFTAFLIISYLYFNILGLCDILDVPVYIFHNKPWNTRSGPNI